MGIITRSGEYQNKGKLEHYAIYAAFAPIEKNDYLIKIGISCTPLDRIYDVHCGSPFPVERAIWMYVGSINQARSAEAIALHAMKEKKTRGEWVRLAIDAPEDKTLFNESLKSALYRAAKLRPKWNHTTIPAIKEALGIEWDTAYPAKKQKS